MISPLALETVRRIDALFEIERTIIGKDAEERRRVRQQRSALLVAALETWMREERAKHSRGNDIAKAFDYMLKRWPSFTRCLDDGRICLTNNAAERALRGIALGRKSWLFAGLTIHHKSLSFFIDRRNRSVIQRVCPNQRAEICGYGWWDRGDCRVDLG